MGNFIEDVKVGEKVQDFIIKELHDEFPSLKSQHGNFANYDLVSEDGYTIEVKFDRGSANTGNVVIEYKYDGEPSGISKTAALEWVHVFSHHSKWAYCRIKVRELKAFIKNNWKYLKKVEGGDAYKSKMVLIPVNDFMDTFPYKNIP